MPTACHGIDFVNEFASYSVRGIAQYLRIVRGEQPTFSAISRAVLGLYVCLLAGILRTSF